MAADIEFRLNANLDSATREVAGFRKQFADLVRDVEKPLRAINTTRELESALSNTGSEIQKAKDRLRTLQNELSRTAHPTDQMRHAFRNAANELARLQRQEATQQQQLSRMREELRAAGIDTHNLTEAQRRLAQEYQNRLNAGRADQAMQNARSVLGVGQIEAAQRQLMELREQYRLVSSDASLSAKQRAELEANYRRELERSLEALRNLRQAQNTPVVDTNLAARSALGVGTIEAQQRKLIQLRDQYRLLTADASLSAKQRAEAERNYSNEVQRTLETLRTLRMTEAQRKANNNLLYGGMSEGQYKNALRMVPAQFTDIVVSLQGGMPPLMVLFQQGGQLKDMFGGLVPAVKELSKYVIGLVNPVSAAATVFGVLGLAAYQGSQEQNRYNQSLALTGDTLGLTSTQLGEMAKRISSSIGTTSKAADTLNTLVASGQISANVIEKIGKAAVTMEKATGQSIDSMIADYESLAVTPVESLERLNRKYNFLTQSVYEQVKALQEEGRMTEAAALAQSTYAEAQQKAADKVIKNLGALRRWWISVRDAAGEAWNSMMNLGRAKTQNEQLADLDKRIEEAQKGMSQRLSEQLTAPTNNILDLASRPLKMLATPVTNPVGFINSVINPDELERLKQQREQLLDDIAGDEAAERQRQQIFKNEQDRIAATKRWNDQEEQYKENALKAEEEIKKIKEDGLKLGKSQAEIDKMVAAIREKYRDKTKKAGSGSVDMTEVNDVQNQLKLIDAQYANFEKNLESRRKAGLIDQQQYLKERLDLLQRERSAVTNALQAQIAALEAAKNKASTNAQQRIRLDQQIADVRTELLKRQGALEAEQERLQDAETKRLEDQAKTNADLQARYLEAAGKETEASMLRIQTAHQQLMQQLTADANTQGIEWAEKLFPLEKVKTQLDGINAAFDKEIAHLNRAENRINVELEVGLITQTEAQQKLLGLRAQEIKNIESQITELNQIITQGGAAAEPAKAQLDEYQTRLIELKNTATDLQKALKEGLTSGIQEALSGLADGTMGLRDAISSLGLSVASALQRIASQKLADQIWSGVSGLNIWDSISGLFNAGSNPAAGAGTGATGTGAASGAATTGTAAVGAATAGAGAVAYSSAISAASSLGATTYATAITSSSGLGAEAIGAAILTAGTSVSELIASAAMTSSTTGGGSSGLFSGLSGLFGGGTGGSSGGFFSSLSGLFGGGDTGTSSGGSGGGSVEDAALQAAMMYLTGGMAATGGKITGPGTETSDSIPMWLSDNEYVVRAASVKQPGAEQFLHDFNRYGMSALDRYHQATGGLAGIPAPAMPEPALGSMQLAEPPRSSNTTVKTAVNLYAIQDEASIASMAWGRAGQENYKVFLRQNANEIRSILKI